VGGQGNREARRNFCPPVLCPYDAIVLPAAQRAHQIADTGLTNFNSGMASAMSMIFTVFLAIVSILVFVLFREREAKRSTTTEGDA